MTTREKRTVLWGAVGIGVYLALFFGVRVLKTLERHRAAYERQVQEARRLKQELRPYAGKALLLQELKESFHMDPAKLSEMTLIADASAALQQAAQKEGVHIGPVRESSSGATDNGQATLRLEGSGPVPSVMKLLYRLRTLGYPILLDSVQLDPETRRPGTVKLTLTVLILDYRHWKQQEEVPNV